MAVGSWKRCPRCGSRDLVEIVYGTPNDPIARARWVEGRLMLRARPSNGSRCNPPGWACRECGYESQPAALVSA